MSVFFNPRLPAFGYPTNQDIANLGLHYVFASTLADEGETAKRKIAQKEANAHVATKAAAYIPLVFNNIVIGVMRMKEAVEATAPSISMEARVAHFVRGLMEALSLGPLLLLIDIVVTVVRYLLSLLTIDVSRESLDHYL